MRQNTVTRPRVAAIGLDEAQIESIEWLCGTLRPADSWQEYLANFSRVETDVTVLGSRENSHPSITGHVLAVGRVGFSWLGLNYHKTSGGWPVGWILNNTERELRVAPDCPERYEDLAAELVRQLSRTEDPPPALTSPHLLSDGFCSLAETTSGRPVALRCGYQPGATAAVRYVAVALAVPAGINLSAWLSALLAEVHELDRDLVPNPPPRLGDPRDWYTPTEQALSVRIEEIAGQVERLEAEKAGVEAELATESEKADAGVRRAIWSDSNELVAAVTAILTDLGFIVRDMDAEREEGEPRREDLRLTVANRSEWEAIAEIKGYGRGTKANDARQIRVHRERYISDNGRPPDLTLWIANPYRHVPPTSRPAPDSNVVRDADQVGAVYVPATTLYQLWARVAAGDLQRETAVEELLNATPGLWLPENLNPGNES